MWKRLTSVTNVVFWYFGSKYFPPPPPPPPPSSFPSPSPFPSPIADKHTRVKIETNPMIIVACSVRPRNHSICDIGGVLSYAASKLVHVLYLKSLHSRVRSQWPSITIVIISHLEIMSAFSPALSLISGNHQAGKVLGMKNFHYVEVTQRPSWLDPPKWTSNGHCQDPSRLHCGTEEWRSSKEATRKSLTLL